MKSLQHWDVAAKLLNHETELRDVRFKTDDLYTWLIVLLVIVASNREIIYHSLHCEHSAGNLQVQRVLPLIYVRKRTECGQHCRLLMRLS